jgi:hypothetical protein
MSRKAVLNATSTKKRDTMIAGNTFPALPTNVGALTVTSDTPAVVMWNATARSAGATPSMNLTMPINAQRLTQTPFIRGLSEKITIRTTTSNAWRWRRIVFFMKGLPPGVQDYVDPNAQRYYTQIDDGTGYLEYQRVNTALPFSMVSEIYRFLFKGFGVNNVTATPRDWMDPITAPIDTARITVAYDKVTQINSGNDAGVVRTYRRWHGVNKTLYYDDVETGGIISSGMFSTTAKMGCGDMYVVDMIVGNSNDEGDILDFLPTTTLYWHEK